MANDLTFSTLQARVSEWSEKNFGKHSPLDPFLGLVEEVGELAEANLFDTREYPECELQQVVAAMAAQLGGIAHSFLKRKQGIRGTAEEHSADLRRECIQLLGTLTKYAEIEGVSLDDMFKTVEQEWQFRTFDRFHSSWMEARAKAEDAVADIAVYLADFCGSSEIDSQKAIEETWERVSKRNWKANPQAGVVPEPDPTGIHVTPVPTEVVFPKARVTGLTGADITAAEARFLAEEHAVFSESDDTSP